MLGRGSRTVLARQQTLLASVGWSYDLLTEQQRIVLRRLSVFAGGCTLEGAEHVVSGDGVDAGEVLELVSQLVDRSLLVAEENAFGTRYRMLETIRQFARDRLVDAREADAVAQRHLAWFTQWVQERGRDAATAQLDSGAAILEVDADYDNIRTAVEWSLAASKHATGLRLLSALWHVVVSQRSGTGLVEATRWVERLLDANDLEPIDRAHGLVALSWMRVFLPDLVGSAMAAVEAEPLARATGDPTLIARTLLILGNSNMQLDPQIGLPQLEECETLARRAGDLTTLSICLMFLAAYYAIIGWPLRGVGYAAEAEQVAIACGNSVTASQARFSFGMCRTVQGFLDEGTELVERCLAEFEAAGNKWFISACLGFLVYLAGHRGDRAEVDRRARLAVERGAALGIPHAAAASLSLVPASVIDGDLDEADRLIAQSTLPPLGWQGRGFEALKGAMRATVLAARGMTDEALALARASAAEARASGLASSLHSCLAIHAAIARASGEAAEAQETVQEWLSIITSTGYVVVAADALDLAAALRADVGNDADAVRLFAAADAQRRSMGAVRMAQPNVDPEAVIASLRERLGAEDFDEVWTAGSALSVGEAIAYASRGWGARNRPQAGWDSLTPTELKVVELVAEGLSNPQIAEKLFISPRTVSTHLSHVFAKVGVGSRAELAAQAVKRAS
jgi:DNA-binding CsgD family transcriptional regulator